MVLTKNFDFLNESTIEFQFKDKIINLISRVENSLKEDEIPNTILNDCRTIYEYIVLQIGLIKGVKINEFEDRTKVKDTWFEIKEMIRFDNNEFLSFDFLRRIGNINSHAISTLQSSKHTIESFVVLQALNCILFLLRALLKQMDINLDDFEPFSSKPYPNVQHQESRIISKKCQKTIDDNNFRAVNSFEINRVTICSLLYQEHTIYKVPIYQRGYEWTKTNIDTLINDIEKRIKDGQEHYLGVIAGRMQKANTWQNGKLIKIIDGQQRMTTSILLLCAVRDVLEQKFKINADYIRIISEFENPGGREISNTALQDLINKQHLFLKSPPYKNDNYYVNYKIFFEYLWKKPKDEILLFYSTYTQNFKIALISFNEDSLTNKNEMEIFENLNTKGKTLELFDITKNYIFNLCTEQTLNEYEKEVVVEFNSKFLAELPGEDNAKKQNWMNDFFISLIHYAIGNELPKIQGRYDLSFYLLKLHETLDQLFPELSKMQNGIDLPIYKKIINSIHRYLKIWKAVKFVADRKDDYLIDMDLHDIVGLITKNKKMVPIYPYVYLFYDMFDIGDLTLKTVKKEVKIYVKTKIFEIIKQLIKHDANIGQGDSTTAKYFWKQCSNARKLWKLNQQPNEDIINSVLQSLVKYANESGDLFTSLNRIDKPNWTHTALLQIIEWHLLGKDNGGAIFKYNPTLEHVLPNKFEENWINDLLSWNNSLTKEQIIEKVKLSINKFGNYCLLTQSWNAKNSNLSFELKKNKLKSLVSPLWRNTLNPKIDIANKEKWNFEEIEARNSELIRIIIEEIYDN